MIDAHGRIALIEIVRTNPNLQQFVDQLFDGGRLVVDSSEKDCLASQGYSRIRQEAASLSNFGRDFLGMSKVDIDEKGVILTKHAGETLSHPHG